MSDVSIRVARKSDIPALDQLLARSYGRLLKPDYKPSVLVSIVPLISRAQPKLVTSGSFYVAQDPQGNLLGAGGWTPTGAFGESSSGLGHIRHFATDPDALRRGVGRALMHHCIDRARASGMTGLACNSTLTAQRFYAAMGFAKLKDIAVELRPGIAFPAVAMHRDI